MNPDGDAIGSQVGLKHLIKDTFPEKQVFAVGDDAKRYSFMDDSTMDDIPDSTYDGALAIVLDTSAKALISDLRFQKADYTVRIDHHIFCERICDYEIDDTSFESCCGLIALFAKEQDLVLSDIAAKSIFTGMVTDSGRFRYDSVSSRTFELASYLMQRKFDTGAIYKNLYAESYQRMKVRSAFTLRMQFTEHNVAYVYSTKQDIIDMEMDAFSVARGLVNTMGDIQGVGIWVNFAEDTDGILCELRSSDININPIAVKYGGGGHAKASGATVKTKEEAMAMLADLDKLIEKQLQEA